MRKARELTKGENVALMMNGSDVLIVGLLPGPFLVADGAESLSTVTMKGAMILGLEEL